MKKRHSAGQVVAKLREADVALDKGLKVPEACRQLGISEQTYYRRRTKYGGRRCWACPTSFSIRAATWATERMLVSAAWSRPSTRCSTTLTTRWSPFSWKPPQGAAVGQRLEHLA